MRLGIQTCDLQVLPQHKVLVGDPVAPAARFLDLGVFSGKLAGMTPPPLSPSHTHTPRTQQVCGRGTPPSLLSV